MNAMTYAIFIFFLAWLVQNLTEALFGTPFELAGDRYSWALRYLSMLVGVGVCVLVDLDLVRIAVEHLSPAPPEWTPWRHWVGLALSGVLLGGVSGFANDFVKWFEAVKISARG